MDFTTATVDQALNSLASCIRCRERRVGCDRMLPSCQACSQTGAECELYDHVLEARFPRSYLLALRQRLSHLDALAATVESQPRRRSSVSSFGHARRESGYQASSKTVSERSSSMSAADSSSQNASNYPASSTPSENPNNETFSEWGPSSAFAHLRVVSRLLDVELSRQLLHGVNLSNPTLIQAPSLVVESPDFYASQAALPPIETSRFLLEFYYHSVEILMPILGRKLGDQDLELLYKDHCTRKNLRPCTCVQLALSIASRTLVRSPATECSPSQSLAYLKLSDCMFEAAVSSLKAAFSDSSDLLDVVSPYGFENEEVHSMAKLQIVLLLVCYVFTVPQKGNVWQLLGFAERLWRKIQNARQQLRRSNSPEGLVVREQALCSTANLLYSSFVSLERIVGPALGRPIDFLEYSEADEPIHMPDDNSVPALHAAIQEIKTRIHSAHLSYHTPGHISSNALPGKSLSAQQRGAQDWGATPFSLACTATPGSLDWYDDIKHQTNVWLARWANAVDAPEPPSSTSPGGRFQQPSFSSCCTTSADPGNETDTIDPSVRGRRDWLLASGRKWRDEALHLAFGLLVQHTTGSGTSHQQPNHPTLLPPALVREGRALVSRLVRSYAYLLRQPFSIQHHGRAIPLVFPRLWTLDLDIFRVAVTAAYLGRHQDPDAGNREDVRRDNHRGLKGKGNEKERGTWDSEIKQERQHDEKKETEQGHVRAHARIEQTQTVDMAWEIATCVKLLATTTSEVNTEALTEAVLAVVGEGVG